MENDGEKTPIAETCHLPRTSISPGRLLYVVHPFGTEKIILQAIKSPISDMKSSPIARDLSVRLSAKWCPTLADIFETIYIPFGL